jgi:hypothetical protein
MATEKCSRISRVLIAALFTGITLLGRPSLCADSGKPVVELNLENYDGKVTKFTGRTDHAVVILSDDTVWAVFPTASKEGSLYRSPGYGFLHISRSGERISQCVWHMPAGYAVEDFFPRVSGGFVIETSSSLISLSSECKEEASIPSTEDIPAATSDGASLILKEDRGLRILDAASLRERGVISLPAGLQDFHRVRVWNRLVLIQPGQTLSIAPCYWTHWPPLSNSQPQTWHSMPCPEEIMTTFGDHAVIVSNWNAASPNISLYNLHGVLLRRFPVDESMTTDQSMFPDDSCSSPLSSQVGVFLYDRKRTWLRQEKITGEHVSVIDLAKGRTLLSLPVTDDDPLLNCSLSKDGKTFAVLRGLILSIFELPE